MKYIIAKMRYISIDVKELNDILRIQKIYIKDEKLNNYKIKIVDSGIGLYNTHTNKLDINYTFDLKTFMKKYLVAAEVYDTKDIDKIVNTIDKIVSIRASKFISFLESFKREFISDCYVELSSDTIEKVIGIQDNVSYYLVYDFGIKEGDVRNNTHLILIAKAINREIKGVCLIDYNKSGKQMEEVSSKEFNKAINLATMVLNTKDIVLIKQIICAFNIIRDSRIEEIYSNIQNLRV